MYRSILVPLDGSPFGEHALPLALNIARRAGAAVQLAHVRVPLEPLYYIDGQPIYDVPDIQSQERARVYLDGLAQRLATVWDIPITVALLDGEAADVLHDHAVATRVDLVVMTTHGRGPLSRFWLGSVTDTLVRQAPMPVLVVRPQEAPPDLTREQVCKHVLIPLDGSALAEQMLERAVAFGTLMGAEFTLLQAISPVVVGYSSGTYTIGLDEQTLEQWRTEARIYLDQFADRLRAQSLRVRTTVVIDQPATAILDYARGHAVDLIAMATHGRVGVSRVLLGSVADKVMRSGTVPVLLHRPYGAVTEPIAAHGAAERRFDGGYGE